MQLYTYLNHHFEILPLLARFSLFLSLLMRFLSLLIHWFLKKRVQELFMSMIVMCADEWTFITFGLAFSSFSENR